MDKPRANPPKKRGKLYAAIAIVGAVGITLGLSRLKPAPPSVDNELAWRDTVELGEMTRQVRGPGTLTPEQVQIISSETAGRITELIVEPGTTVTPETVLLRLTNPDEELQMLTAERNLSNARGMLLNLRTTLESTRLSQAAAIASLQSQFDDAKRQDRINEELNSKQLITKSDYETAKNNLRQLEQRLDYEKKRLAVQENTIDDQLRQQQDEINRLEQIVSFQRDKLNSMQVRAKVHGVLSRLGTTGRLEIGQYVQSGTELARVVPSPTRLKAELRIPETQVVDIAVGDSAEIDIRNGVIMGRVTRIDPSATTGTVGVDVSLPDNLPAGARPDLSVDGRIIVDRLANVLHVGRPQHANSGATIGLFKLEPDGKHAERATVVVGAASVNEMEVKSGLKEGDIVILSDMSQWDSYPRIRLR